MSWVEVLGFVSGAACVWLATRQNVWNFPVGIANNLLFLWLFAHTGLYANAGLQVVFAALAVLGWVWFGETLGVVAVIGCFAVVAGIIIAQSARAPHVEVEPPAIT